MDTRTLKGAYTEEEIEEMKNDFIEREKTRNGITMEEVRKLVGKPSQTRTNWQRSATMKVFYKSKARKKNKLQKMSRKANRQVRKK